MNRISREKKQQRSTWCSRPCRKSLKFPNQTTVSVTLVKCIGQSLTTLKKNLDIAKKQQKKKIEENQTLEKGMHFKHDRFIAETAALTNRKTMNTGNIQTKQKINNKKKHLKNKSFGKKFIIEFKHFARFQSEYSRGCTISYAKTLRWLKEAKIFDNRRITMRDVEVHFIHRIKSGFELTVLEFIYFLKSLCEDRGLSMFTVLMKLVTCRYQKTSDIVPLSNLRKPKRKRKLTSEKKIFYTGNNRKKSQIIRTFKVYKAKQPNEDFNESIKDTINTKMVNSKIREHSFYIDLQNAPIPVRNALSDGFGLSLNKDLQIYKFVVPKNGERMMHDEELCKFKASTISKVRKTKFGDKLVGKTFSEAKIKWNKILKKANSFNSYFNMVVLGNTLNINESETYEYTPPHLSSSNLHDYSINKNINSCGSSERRPLHVERISYEVAILQIDGTTETLKSGSKTVGKCDSNKKSNGRMVVEKYRKQKISTYFVSDNSKGKTFLYEKRNTFKRKNLTKITHTLSSENKKYKNRRASASNFSKNNVKPNYNFGGRKKCVSPNPMKKGTANMKQTLPPSQALQNKSIKKGNRHKTVPNSTSDVIISSKSKLLKNHKTGRKYSKTFSNLPVYKLEKALQKSKKRKMKKMILKANDITSENSTTISKNVKKRPYNGTFAIDKSHEFGSKLCSKKNGVTKADFGKKSSSAYMNVLQSPLDDSLEEICKNKHALLRARDLKDNNDDFNVCIEKGSSTNSVNTIDKVRYKTKYHLISERKGKVCKIRKRLQLGKKEMNDPETEIEKLMRFNL